jgi:two-component system, NtrC family, sensor kinase
MMHSPISTTLPRWDLAAGAIAVKIRWVGLLLGYVYVNSASDSTYRLTLNLILTVGFAYTVIDAYYSWQARIFLARFPVAISFMEALFIGLLCYFDSGLESPFRYYYLLSLICCAIRHSSVVTYVTCALDCLSYAILYFAVDHPEDAGFALFLMMVLLLWVTWAASALSDLLKEIGEHLGSLNVALRENQTLLESRIDERTRELQETQAQVLHQEKMAGFGLLAAGIAHEVGNPLTSISTLIQMLEKRDYDTYTYEKLSLVGGQLTRIHGILRELINFSRPASQERTRFHVHDIVEEALNIAKYYKGTKTRTIRSEVARDLPRLQGVRDQLVQVIFNLVLNAIDATNKGGIIEVKAESCDSRVTLSVRDEGVGISEEQQKQIFQPYFTTKKQGTGLGLFVTQRLVQQHGGSVEFESQIGKGTTFRIHLPASNRASSS